MSSTDEMSFTVTYAVHDEIPIACQGDDDQATIRVIVDRVKSKNDVHAEALKRSIAMSKSHGKHVQVWDVQAEEEIKNAKL